MTGMFADAGELNRPIGEWKTGKVTDMVSMFYEASAFTLPIGVETGKVSDMSGIFFAAASYQRLCKWNRDRWVTSPSRLMSAVGAAGVARVTTCRERKSLMKHSS
jgi:surface protein